MELKIPVRIIKHLQLNNNKDAFDLIMGELNQEFASCFLPGFSSQILFYLREVKLKPTG